jgi:hypothetical protein
VYNLLPKVSNCYFHHISSFIFAVVGGLPPFSLLHFRGIESKDADGTCDFFLCVKVSLATMMVAEGVI